MKSKLTSILITIVVLALLVMAGYMLYTRYVSADTADEVVADLNNDNKVDSQDLNSLLKAVGDKSENPKFDVNQDGSVDSADVDALLKNWTDESATE
jgi:flagellar basal body-associated protein FliL